MAIPQNIEKFDSISVYWLVLIGAPVRIRPCESRSALPLSSISTDEFHHFGSNACWIRAAYVVLMPFDGALLIGPSTLSSVATSCLASGCNDSIFLPNFFHVRPSYDISTGLFGGPTA